MKAQEIERQKLINIKDAYENKEIDFNKQSSELRVQVIELQESNVSVHHSIEIYIHSIKLTIIHFIDSTGQIG